MTDPTALAALCRDIGNDLAAQAEAPGADLDELGRRLACVTELLTPTDPGFVPVVKYEPATSGAMENHQ